MNFFDFLTLFGGLAMFLYGMRLMGDGLKESSSGALKVAMEMVTNNPIKAFLLGLGVTAIIQSSTATIVITSGLVSAGLLTLHQSLGIIVGANVGTTVTGQIIRLLDLNASSGGASWLNIFKPSSLAPIALILGIIMIMSGRPKNSRQFGNIAIGFGILFSGLMSMTNAVSALSESGIVETLFTGLGNNPIIGYLTGAGIAFVLQSSSATIGILQAFAASGALKFNAVYPVIVGVYLGDSVTTAIVCSIGAPVEQKRVGIVNTIYNLCKSAMVLIAVGILHHLGFLDSLWSSTVTSGVIANTNTVFNLVCAILLLPFMGFFEQMTIRIVPDEVKPEEENKYKEKFESLNPAFFDTPAIALNSCYDVLLTQLELSRQNIEKSFGLLNHYDQEVYDEIIEREDYIDMFADRLSKYMAQFLPYLHNDLHVSILDEYYKVVAEFERLGDHAVNIADNAKEMYEHDKIFSKECMEEIEVMCRLLMEILDNVEVAFMKRDVKAAFMIEPLQEVVGEVAGRLKKRHLSRMSRGECDVYADANFVNLLSDMIRIADVSTNIGEAVLIRVHPEIADDEHRYFAELRSGENKKYSDAYEAAHNNYIDKLNQIEGSKDHEIHEADDRFDDA